MFDGTILPSPYPGAAWCSGQMEDEDAEAILAALEPMVDGTVQWGYGAVFGVDDPEDELGPEDETPLEGPYIESLARVYARLLANAPPA